MDFIKKATGDALNKKEGKSSSSNDNNNNNNDNSGNDNKNEQQNAKQGAGERDYLDKGIGFVSKKAGYNMNRDTEEKVGDGMRNAYEKYSGKKVPDKFSN